MLMSSPSVTATEFSAQAGSVNVVPHAGIRMTRIDMDDSRFGVEYDTMTLWQMPIGASPSQRHVRNDRLEARPDGRPLRRSRLWRQGRWFSIGTDADSCRVVDSNPVQATLGIAAQKDAWTFGLNYRMTGGSDNSMNNSFNASARYTF